MAVVSRRAFLGAGAFAAALLAVSRLRAPPEDDAGGTELRVLSGRDAAILAAIAARITFTGDAEMPRFDDTRALVTIDGALRHLDAGARRQLGIALKLFEYGPMLFDFRFARFTELAPAEQDAHLAGWSDSRFDTRRLAFRAMKNLAFLGYYTQDATWKGIHYLGPVLPLPRRAEPA